jgi:hypothetical protein
LGGPAVGGEIQRVRRDHAEHGQLRHRQVEEDDAARQHPAPQRHVGGQHQQADDERPQQQAGIERGEVQCAAFSS